MNDWEGLFSQMQQQLDSKCNNRFSFTPKHMSTFLSLCLISLFACLLVSLAALLTTVSWCPFLSQWICLSEQSHSRRNRWVWNVPTLHTTMDDSSPQWGCVPECFSCLHMRLFSLSLSIHSIFFLSSLYGNTFADKISRSPQCLRASVSIFPLFRDIQSSSL